MRSRPLHRLPILLLAALVAGCGSAGGGEADAGADGGSPDAGEHPALLAERFVARALSDWEGVDYSMQTPDGRTDSDGDGAVDADDAVIVIETLRALGHEVPPTGLQGLYEGYYTPEGYAADPTSELGRTRFSYTRPVSVSGADLKDHDWSGLMPGDLLFVDYDEDYLWDVAALYVGAHGEVAHAAFHASDYYDRALVVDLDDASEVLVLDIGFGRVEVRSLDFEAITALR